MKESRDSFENITLPTSRRSYQCVTTTTKMKKLTGQFRNTTWDPFLIISQIVAMQCIFYSCLGLWLLMLNIIQGSYLSLDRIFLYQAVHVRDVGGQVVIAAFVLNSLTGAVGLWVVVQRTKQCLDFSSTAHFLHLILCWMYCGQFPSSISWWLLNLACLAIMCISGEFLCLRSELKAIPLNMGPKADL